MKKYLVLAFLLSGCASIGSQEAATLTFTGEAKMGLPGGIVAVDGVANPPSNRTIEVPPGHHTIAYHCPDVVTLDDVPTIQASFASGNAYELVCEGVQAAIRLK